MKKIILMFLFSLIFSQNKDYSELSFAADIDSSWEYYQCYFTDEDNRCEDVIGRPWDRKVKYESIYLIEATLEVKSQYLETPIYLVELCNCIDPQIVSMTKKECKKDEKCVWFDGQAYYGSSPCVQKNVCEIKLLPFIQYKNNE